MIKRTLVFEKPSHLSLKDGQLYYRPKEGGEEARTIALEDLGFVLVENPAVTLSARLIERLNRNGTAVIFCDAARQPCAMLQTFQGHSTHAEILRLQIEASLPLKKRLWKQIVQAKLMNQAALLSACDRPGAENIRRLARGVRSDDAGNHESRAARVYWRYLFDRPDFRRARDGEWPNPALNYGYAVLRAAAARALAGSGLYCAIGLHHRNRYNAFCLADDFMEPYRPYVDRIVCGMLSEEYQNVLCSEVKRLLLRVLIADTYMKNQRRPLMLAMSQSSASLVRCLAGEEKTITFPLLR